MNPNEITHFIELSLQDPQTVVTWSIFTMAAISSLVTLKYGSLWYQDWSRDDRFGREMKNRKRDLI